MTQKSTQNITYESQIDKKYNKSTTEVNSVLEEAVFLLQRKRKAEV